MCVDSKMDGNHTVNKLKANVAIQQKSEEPSCRPELDVEESQLYEPKLKVIKCEIAVIFIAVLVFTRVDFCQGETFPRDK